MSSNRNSSSGLFVVFQFAMVVGGLYIVYAFVAQYVASYLGLSNIVNNLSKLVMGG